VKDRRVYFFLVAAVVVFLVQPLVPQFRWLTLTVTVIYLLFALAFALASIAADNHAKRNGHL
jgi:thiol:disulfide interchange protein